VWGFRNCPTGIKFQQTATNAGGYPASYAHLRLEDPDQSYVEALAITLGKDYLYAVRRLVSTKNNSTVFTAKAWVPNEGEVFGAVSLSDDPSPQISIPLYTKGASYRIKRIGSTASFWFTGSPTAARTTDFVGVNFAGAVSQANANSSSNNGHSIHFCQV
jgi:hypothetical protein